MHYAKIASKVREQIIRFSGELSSGWPKTAQRFLAEAVYGIQARQSVHLTEIARALDEKIHLKKTHNRIDRQLGREDLGDWLERALIEKAADEVDKKSLLILDISDISKKYARKMEYMARVRDSSEKVLTQGYWTCSVIGAEANKLRLVPIYGKLYSQDCPDFISENTEIIKAFRRVSRATDKKGIWVVDRGGDRPDLYHHLLKEKLSFVIRVNSVRPLLYWRRKRAAADLTASCSLPYMERIVRQEAGKEKAYKLLFGSMPVKLPGYKQVLSLVVVCGFGRKPLMLLTTMRVTKSRKSHWQVIQSYMTRWRIEETIRFVKQSYRLEDIRLLTYRRLQNMMRVLTAVMYFAMVYLGLGVKMRILAGNILKVSRRVFAVPDFHFYALSDGIRNLLFGRQKGLQRFFASPKYSAQLNLFDP